MSTAVIPSVAQLRSELGDFSSIVCFKALVVGTEEVLGEKAAAIALIGAGRQRGRQVADQLGIAEQAIPFDGAHLEVGGLPTKSSDPPKSPLKRGTLNRTQTPLFKGGRGDPPTVVYAPFDELVKVLQSALGKDGTRLCIVEKIFETGETISVYCRETICLAGEPEGSPRKLTFTLGAVQGVMERVTGKRLRGKQTESVLRGSAFDVIEFEVLA